MISYYLNSGDSAGADLFIPYVWGERGVGTLLKERLSKSYGIDMDLILILYYLEGQFSGYLPVPPQLGNYMKKSKDIRISIGVTRSMFHNRNEFERREFVVDSTLNAIALVKERMIKKKLNIDFKQLIEDVNLISKDYLKYPKPYTES